MRLQQRLALTTSHLLDPPVYALRPAHFFDGGESFLPEASSLASIFAGHSLIDESQPPIATATSVATATKPSGIERVYTCTSTPLPGRPEAETARSLAPGCVRDVPPAVTAGVTQGGGRIQQYRGIHSIFLKVTD